MLLKLPATELPTHQGHRVLNAEITITIQTSRYPADYSGLPVKRRTTFEFATSSGDLRIKVRALILQH